MIMTTTYSVGMFDLPCEIRMTEIPKAVVEHMDLDIRANAPVQANLLARYLVMSSEDMLVNRQAIYMKPGENFIYANLLNRSGMKIQSLEDASKLEPYRDYSYKFILVEVVR
jgi:hypothetical protein